MRKHTNRLWLSAALLLVATPATNAAFEYPDGSVSSFSMAFATDLHQAAALDLYGNPALARECKVQSELSLSRLYNIPDFDYSSGLVQACYRGFSCGVGLTQLTGSDYYRERSYLLALSLALHRNLRLGASANILRIEFGEGYGSLSLVSFSVGGVLRISDALVLGGAARNINTPSYSDNAGSLPLAGNLSLSYRFSERYSFFLTHHFEEKMNDRFSLGQKINIVEQVDLRFGFATQPTVVSGGVSFRFGQFRFDYGFSDNVYLGGTHKAGLRWIR